jgi:hypothetical protein
MRHNRELSLSAWASAASGHEFATGMGYNPRGENGQGGGADLGRW